MENQTIIVKKIKKGGHGHHGGAWKVAFADFAVAMMAFFLLLWLIASTTKEEQAGLSEYFSPPTQGLADGSGTKADIVDLGGGQKISQGDDSKEDAREARAPTKDEIQQAVAAEKERLESLMEELKKAIENSQALKPFKDQLLLDITPEGLRIQIVDKENRPMFASGSAELKSYTKEILRELAKTINTVPNRISLTGHTDAAPFVSKRNYTNWELSADRANASRRELVTGGLGTEKIAKVVGLSSMVPFNKEDPRSPINRRIAIIVMNKAAEQALLHPAETVSDDEEAKALIDKNASAAPVRTFRGAVAERRVREAAEREAREPAVQDEPESELKHKVEPEPDPEAVHTINPIPKLKPIQEIEPIREPAVVHKPDDKPVIKDNKPDKKPASKAGREEPDYTGMSISERIKARAEWNKRKAAEQH